MSNLQVPELRGDEKSLEDGSLSSQEPMPSVKESKPSFFSRARVLGPVEKEHGDLPLLACCYVTGLIDAATFSNWLVFVGMQTGNTVILGLSTAGLPDNPHGYYTTLTSISSFLIGSFLSFRMSKLVTPKGPDSNRLCLSLLFFIQGVFVVIAAALATVPGLVPQNPGNTTRFTFNSPSVIDNPHVVILLPLLGLQSGMQIAASRLLGFNELPINVVTSTYCDLMGDFNLFALHNVKRNRRVAAVLLTLAGAISSGWLMRSSGGLMSVLFLGAGVKMMVGILVFIFFPTKRL